MTSFNAQAPWGRRAARPEGVKNGGERAERGRTPRPNNKREEEETEREIRWLHAVQLEQQKKKRGGRATQNVGERRRKHTNPYDDEWDKSRNTP